jgi:hypothetical protein
VEWTIVMTERRTDPVQVFVFEGLPQGWNPISVMDEPARVYARYVATNALAAVQIWHKGNYPEPLRYSYGVHEPPVDVGGFRRWRITCHPFDGDVPRGTSKPVQDERRKRLGEDW